MNKVFATFLLMLFLTSMGQAQTNADILYEADYHYRYGNVDAADSLYETLQDHEDPAIYFKMASCYMRGSEKTKAISPLEKAYGLNPSIDKNILYLLGLAYQSNHQFGESRKRYEMYLQTLGMEDSATISKTKRRLEECGYGEKLLAKPSKVRIENLGDSINSIYDEYAPVTNPDATSLYFTARRTGLCCLMENIYVSNKTNAHWSSIQALDSTVNGLTHNASLAFFPDGKTFYIYQDDNNGDIYSTYLKRNGRWARFKAFKPINSIHKESSLTITKDGQTVYFSSDRPGGYGGLDIYMIKRQPNGQWGKAINLGPRVNTSSNEDAPFIHPDGHTLYFSSTGHEGMGGYDIFKATLMQGVWTKPENVGYPINSTADDIFFILSTDDQHGYFSSNRPGGKGGHDIYSFTGLIE